VGAARVETIAQALRQAAACDRDTLRGMGERGRELVAKEYAWEQVGRRTAIGKRARAITRGAEKCFPAGRVARFCVV
jgi:hypothetical protein